MSILLPNGLGSSASGDSVASCKPLQVSGDVWYVSSLVGDDSYDGRNRERPLATVKQAITNSADYDVICCMAGHAETIKDLALRIGTRLIGEGTAGGKPSVTLTNDGTNTTCGLQLLARAEVRNIYFPTATALTNNQRIRVYGVSGCCISSCYFEGAANDTEALILASETTGCGGVKYGPDYLRIENTTFVSTELTGTPPCSAITVNDACAGLALDGVVFDDGVVGWANGSDDYAMSILAAASGMKADGISLLHGASVYVYSTSKGTFNVQTATGGGRVVW